jgi:hypothetical protein
MEVKTTCCSSKIDMNLTCAPSWIRECMQVDAMYACNRVYSRENAHWRHDYHLNKVEFIQLLLITWIWTTIIDYSSNEI